MAKASKKTAAKAASKKKSARAKTRSKKTTPRKKTARTAGAKTAATKTKKSAGKKTKKAAGTKSKKRQNSKKANTKRTKTALTGSVKKKKRAATKKTASRKSTASIKKKAVKKAATKKTATKKHAANLLASAGRNEARTARTPARAGTIKIAVSSARLPARSPAKSPAKAKVNRGRKRILPVEPEVPTGPVYIAGLRIMPPDADLPKSRLKPERLAEFRKQLLDKRRELVGDVDHLTNEALRRNRHDSSGDLSNMPIHMADVGSDNWEQEFALGLIDNERTLLREIEDALNRIADGTYGICLATHKPIAVARLRAKPWAKYCIEYARLRERGIVR